MKLYIRQFNAMLSLIFIQTALLVLVTAPTNQIVYRTVEIQKI